MQWACASMSCGMHLSGVAIISENTIEANRMHRLLILGGLLLGTAIITPMVVRADGDDHPYNKRYYDHKRYYDRDGRDYHVWNDREDRAYRSYLGEQRREYREWRAVK